MEDSIVAAYVALVVGCVIQHKLVSCLLDELCYWGLLIKRWWFQFLSREKDSLAIVNQVNYAKWEVVWLYCICIAKWEVVWLYCICIVVVNLYSATHSVVRQSEELYSAGIKMKL